MDKKDFNLNIWHQVPPIVVPQNFDRATAMSRYLKKRKSTMKADYSVRREIALRITRRGGKFAPSEKNSENSVGTEAAELQFCANCRESSEVTPQMRRGPTGAKNFCNACGCGLAWATYVSAPISHSFIYHSL
ncbi:hypothetical protein BDA96_05G176500 [Sorghum bicolor]|uniref:GATA-type domain-containing protein n=1 Tax=Sorghum bicolor TaxID=4558 RepID=A0A921QZW3_SORBI|nr:hypothetical protein BDA96_05G176500 [Sorghum bicolor]